MLAELIINIVYSLGTFVVYNLYFIVLANNIYITVSYV